MFIGTLAIHLRLETCHSLKEKRSIVKSIIARLRNEFNISVAEVAEQDHWQTAVIGVAGVSGNKQYVQQQLHAVIDWVYDNRPDVEIIQTDIEVL